MDRKINFWFLFSFLVLLIFGFILITSTSAPFSETLFGHPFYYLRHQLIFGFVPGLICGILLLFVNLERIKRYTIFLLLFNLLFLFLVFVPPLSASSRGATRWIKLGAITLQPSEFLKISFILYLSAWISSKSRKKNIEFLIYFLIIFSVIALFLILQPDISTLGVISVVAVVIFFLGKTPLWQTMLFVICFAFLFLILSQTAPYRLKRLLVFLNPNFDPMGAGYHLKQAEIAIGSGGIWGRGLGLSEHKFGFLPHPFSDSIFAVFAEEAGMIGSIFLLSLYFVLFTSLFFIGIKQRNDYYKLIVFGILVWFSFQTFVNIGAMVGLVPLTGIPLPLLSYGGSHLIAEVIAFFLILNICKRA